MARDTGIAHARHPSYPFMDFSKFSWQDFSVREQLIRVFTWVFLLDTAFVIFNNVPPRMAIKEMKMHLASNEACFQALTSEQCLRHLQNSLPHDGYTLTSLTAMMCKEPITIDNQTLLADIGPLNMFASISGSLYLLPYLNDLFTDTCSSTFLDFSDTASIWI